MWRWALYFLHVMHHLDVLNSCAKSFYKRTTLSLYRLPEYQWNITVCKDDRLVWTVLDLTCLDNEMRCTKNDNFGVNNIKNKYSSDMTKLKDRDKDGQNNSKLPTFMGIKWLKGKFWNNIHVNYCYLFNSNHHPAYSYLGDN